MEEKHPTTVVFSICFELLWGYLDNLNSKRARLLLANPFFTKKCIYSLLRLFDEYKVPTTWACVGGLFLDKDEVGNLIYIREELCKLHNFLDVLYGKDIVESIFSSDLFHEIGYHTLTHTVFTECSKFRAEFEIAYGIKLARQKFNLKLKSFIFPKNKIKYLDLLEKYGFKIFRGRNIWLNNINSVVFKLFNTEKVEVNTFNSLIELPTSMLFDNPLPLPILRSITGIEFGRFGDVFHISLHPESLVAYGNKLKYQLGLLLKYLSKRRQWGRLCISTMENLARLEGTR